jgi:hypothetical protein
MEPRVIRAKWENDFNGIYCKQIYLLAAGPVLPALHVNKESRNEAKRKYSLVKSRLPFVANHPCDPHSIWVNLDTDTIYFVNFPATATFLSWMRRFTNKRTGGANKNIKHIAIHACVLDRLTNIPNLPHKTDFIYQLVAEHPTLTDITIMLDNSMFEDDSRPQAFTIVDAKPLGSQNKGGGRWGNRKVRSKMTALFDTFFTQVRASGRTEWEIYRKFRENNPQWVEPSFPMMTITKSPKAVAGSSLPVVPRRFIPGAKSCQAGNSSARASGPKR